MKNHSFSQTFTNALVRQTEIQNHVFLFVQKISRLQHKCFGGKFLWYHLGLTKLKEPALDNLPCFLRAIEPRLLKLFHKQAKITERRLVYYEKSLIPFWDSQARTQEHAPKLPAAWIRGAGLGSTAARECTRQATFPRQCVSFRSTISKWKECSTYGSRAIFFTSLE